MNFYSTLAVRVHSKFCPSLNETDFHSLPNWFRLEAISEVTSATVGKFVRPSSRSESHLCSEDTVSDTTCILSHVCTFLFCMEKNRDFL